MRSPTTGGPTRKYLGAGIDNSGKVFRYGENIYRELSNVGESVLQVLLNDKALIGELIDEGLVPSEFVSAPDNPANRVLKHREIRFESYLHEWSFDMLRDAALMMVRLEETLWKNDFTLKDAHPYNVLFSHCDPIMIDLSSIVKRTRANLRGWRRGMIGEFLVPLILKSRNLESMFSAYCYLEDYPAFKTYILELINFFWLPLANRSQHDLNDEISISLLESRIKALTHHRSKTEWDDYYRRAPFVEIGNFDAYTNKEASAINFMKATRGRGSSTLLDIASNEGWFSFAAANLGFDVVAFDNDRNSINRLYQKNKRDSYAILPLIMDFRNPTRAHGPNRIWKKAEDRLKCDVSLCMAILHHLTLGQDMSFFQFAERLASFTNKFAIVEFIRPDDVHIRNRIQTKSWYTEKNFLDAMSKHFKKEGVLPSEPSTRNIFLFKRI